jgi:hypothetical protein
MRHSQRRLSNGRETFRILYLIAHFKHSIFLQKSAMRPVSREIAIARRPAMGYIGLP